MAARIGRRTRRSSTRRARGPASRRAASPATWRATRKETPAPSGSDHSYADARLGAEHEAAGGGQDRAGEQQRDEHEPGGKERERGACAGDFGEGAYLVGRTRAEERATPRPQQRRQARGGGPKLACASGYGTERAREKRCPRQPRTSPGRSANWLSAMRAHLTPDEHPAPRGAHARTPGWFEQQRGNHRARFGRRLVVVRVWPVQQVSTVDQRRGPPPSRLIASRAPKETSNRASSPARARIDTGAAAIAADG